jgi:hypothetical protein
VRSKALLVLCNLLSANQQNDAIADLPEGMAAEEARAQEEAMLKKVHHGVHMFMVIW